MSKIRMLGLLLLLLLLAACEHKELLYASPQFRALRVEFDWSRYGDHEKPEGMRVVFYPTDGASEPWIFDFPRGEAQLIELPYNDYQVVCYNYDTDGIVWKNSGSYSELTASVRGTQSPEGEQASFTPSWLCGDHIDQVMVKADAAAPVQVVTLFPVRMVCRYTYEVNGIRRIDRAADIRASLTDMVGSLRMATDQLPEGLSERLLFGGEVKGQQVNGGFHTFGCCQGSDEPNLFKLYIRSKQGQTHVLECDVSEQVHAVPVAGHIGDVHIVIHVDFEIPGGIGGDDDAGFDVGVDDWADVNQDILC